MEIIYYRLMHYCSHRGGGFHVGGGGRIPAIDRARATSSSSWRCVSAVSSYGGARRLRIIHNIIPTRPGRGCQKGSRRKDEKTRRATVTRNNVSYVVRVIFLGVRLFFLSFLSRPTARIVIIIIIN